MFSYYQTTDAQLYSMYPSMNMHMESYDYDLKPYYDFLSSFCTCDILSPQNFQNTIQDNNGGYTSPLTPADKNTKVSIAGICLDSSAKSLLQSLTQKFCDDSTIMVYAKKKHERRKRSNRRSTFIGVSKNGPSWQAMITVNRIKTYIGTYRSERDAAIAFDFYSTLVHNLGGKTNMNYSKGQLIQMLTNFLQNDQVLDVYTLNL